MTVQDVQQNVEYVGNGAQTNFVFVFRVDDPAWVSISFPDNFSALNVNANQDTTPGGSIDYSVAPPSGQSVGIARSTPKDQDLDYTRYDAFDSESHEDALDKLTMLIQDLCEAVNGTGGVGGGSLQSQIDDINQDITDLQNDTFISFCIKNQILGSVAGAVIFDYNLGMGIRLNLTENISTITFSNVPAGGDVCQFEIDIRQDATPRSIAWPGTVLWPGAIAPNIGIAGSITQVHLRTTNGGGQWLGSYVENES
ncbi:MAG: hypothetical protein KAS38_07400 [Anaerolineales bacterium]|nr:hypothetical protein [Anaerolineales bacterium]